MQYLWYDLYSANMKGRVRLNAILGSLRRRPPFAVFPCTGDVAGINRVLQKHCSELLPLQRNNSVVVLFFLRAKVSVRDKSVQTWQGMIFKIWKNSADRQFEQEAAVSGSYQVAPSASTDGQFGQFGGKKGRSHNNWCRFWEKAKKPPCGNYCPFASASGNHWTGSSCQRYRLVTFYLGTI